MKKVSLLIAMIAFVCGNAFAQMHFDFDDCPEGAKIAQTLGDPWTTWSNAPGGSEDGVFGMAGGTMACHFTFNNDQVVMLGDHSTGVYDLEFDAYVPEGKNGYFNVLHHFAGSNSTWAMQVYMHMTNDGQNSTQAPNHGTVHAGSNGTCDLPCVYDEWMHFRVHVDADNDVAQLYFNVVGQAEELYAEWQWSLDSFGENTTDRVLGAMDFYPPENAATSEYYLDNLTVTLQSNDQVLLFEPFEEYTVGNKIAAEAVAAGHDWWTTWSNQPGGNEDGVVSDFDTKCGHLTYGNDQVLLLGDEENGNYDLEFDILIPEGKNGYFNILHHFAGSNSTWAMQCYLHLTNDGQNSTSAPGQGTIHAGSNGTATLTGLVYDQWMHFRLNVDTDTDVANYYYTAPGEQEVLVCTWQWSLDSFGNSVVGRTLAAMNFYPPENAATSEYYLDNFSFKKIGGESAPELTITPDAIHKELGEDDMTTVDITINNDGNSIGDWQGWLDFGEGQGGTATQVINYDNEPGTETSLVGWSFDEPTVVEVGAMFPAASYAGAVMGTKITKAQYYLGEGSTGNGIEVGTDLTLRIYRQGQGEYAVGEVLAEKTIPYNQIVTGDWNIVTFDTPVDLTGFNFFVAAEYTQAVDGYAANLDGGTPVPYGDLYRQRASGNFNSFAANGGNVYGNTHIRVTCQGTPVLATWATINKNFGSIMGGQSETIILTLNSIGLEDGTYNADLVINTNDAELSHVEIPVTLVVDGTGVVETVSQLANIYPNPATSMVTLEGDNLSAVAIYNMAGQLVRVVKLDSMVNNIDMNVEAGVYFFSIYDNNGNNSVQRVVIVK